MLEQEKEPKLLLQPELKTGQTLWYLMEVVSATVAGSIGKYSGKKGVEGEYNSNTEVKQE